MTGMEFQVMEIPVGIRGPVDKCCNQALTLIDPGDLKVRGAKKAGEVSRLASQPPITIPSGPSARG